jgi:hypothetical protein
MGPSLGLAPCYRWSRRTTTASTCKPSVSALEMKMEKTQLTECAQNTMANTHSHLAFVAMLSGYPMSCCHCSHRGLGQELYLNRRLHKSPNFAKGKDLRKQRVPSKGLKIECTRSGAWALPS